MQEMMFSMPGERRYSATFVEGWSGVEVERRLSDDSRHIFLGARILREGAKLPETTRALTCMKRGPLTFACVRRMKSPRKFLYIHV